MSLQRKLYVPRLCCRICTNQSFPRHAFTTSRFGFHNKVKSAEGTVQGLVSHWNRELWQQKVRLWGPRHLHQGKKQKTKNSRGLTKVFITQVSEFIPWIEKKLILRGL